MNGIMEITKAMELASEMLFRYDSGETVKSLITGMAGTIPVPAAKESGKRACESANYIIQRLPHLQEYEGVVATLEANKDKAGVQGMLERVYEAFPNLKEDFGRTEAQVQ